MKTVTYQNNSFDIPTSWDEVTLKQIIHSEELQDMFPESQSIAVMSAFTGIPVHILKKGKTNEITTILANMEFLDTLYQAKPLTEFILNDEKYFCDPVLTNQLFEDWVSMQQTLYNYKDNMSRGLPRLIAILCKKEGESLDSFELNERTRLMYELPYTTAKDIEAFFLLQTQAYKGLMLISSTINEQREAVLIKIKELKTTLTRLQEQNGGSFFTKLQIGLYKIQLSWVKRQLEKYYNSQPIEDSKKNWMQTFKKLLTKTAVENNE